MACDRVVSLVLNAGESVVGLDFSFGRRDGPCGAECAALSCWLGDTVGVNVVVLHLVRECEDLGA